MKKTFTYLLAVALFYTSCTKSPIERVNAHDPQEHLTGISGDSRQQFFYESFNGGSKASYAAGSAQLSSGQWYFKDALVQGGIANNKCVRLQNDGSVGMGFDVNMIYPSTVSIAHAAFNEDGPSSWTLWASNNQGKTYQQIGAELTTNSTVLETVTFQVNLTGDLRFEIRRSADRNSKKTRLLIDNFKIDLKEPVSKPSEDSQGVSGDNSHMLLGNPDKSEPSVVNPNKYLMNKTFYQMSYNNQIHSPNWVSWHLDKSDLGDTKRRDNFKADTYLPEGWYAVSSTSYFNSGFDRGHNCPSGDRTNSSEANESTFLMTNMIPQAPKNNQQTWENLESYTRSLIKSGSEAYITMGSYGIGGTGKNGYMENITDKDGKEIRVPKYIWKVIVIIPNGNDDLNRIDANTRVIAVITPNDNSINADWKQYRTTVNAIEQATGYNLLSNLPSSLQIALEGKVDKL